MSNTEQLSEVARLNKGAVIGMKGAIKKQRIHSQYKYLVANRMKEHVFANRTQETKMFRTVQNPRVFQNLQVKRLSVGEWVEVDADQTPGWNSEGGIGVITHVHDGLADVKYVNYRPTYILLSSTLTYFNML